MRKVYCTNCRFFNKSFVFHYFDSWRECKKEMRTRDKYDAVERYYPVSCNVRNEANNCLNYRKRWWLFWRKK